VAFVAADKNLCLGCEICELICSLAHGGEFKPSISRIHIRRDPFEGDFTPEVCTQCSRPMCLEACLEGAVYVDADTGAKVIVEDMCTGCGECARACPFNYSGTVLKYDPERRVYVKCDLCGGEAECVKWCPSGALSLKRGG
jgi:Fe-S-cluster-containing hydrogenase component 2